MRLTKDLRKDQETVLRFLNVLGEGSVALAAGNRYARPDFFLSAVAFIREYIEGKFFQREEVLLKALEDNGFPPDSGPLGTTRDEQRKSLQSAELLLKAAQAWQAGEGGARIEVGWAASEYTSLLRRHLDRLKNLIFPLLEQNLSPEEEQQALEALRRLAPPGSAAEEANKHIRLIEALEEELSDWK